MTPARVISTVGGVGLMRPAPGTWGSLVALPLAAGLHILGGFPLLVVATVGVFALGWWATAEATRGMADHDPSEIVIDEVVGMWITLLPVSMGAWNNSVDVLALWPGWVVGFIAFRAFDITKPSLVGWADRMSTPLGVMLDDVIAGLFAAVVVAVAAGVAHGLMGL
jgi:phosphatidylglycerophosphatase A